MSPAMTPAAVGNALDFQPGFIGPKWDVLKRWRYLRDLERVRCVMIVDDLLKQHGAPSDFLPIDLDAVVQLRAEIARLNDYEQFHSDYLKRWRDVADAAGADLTTFTLPVEAAVS